MAKFEKVDENNIKKVEEAKVVETVYNVDEVKARREKHVEIMAQCQQVIDECDAILGQADSLGLASMKPVEVKPVLETPTEEIVP